MLIVYIREITPPIVIQVNRLDEPNLNYREFDQLLIVSVENILVRFSPKSRYNLLRFLYLNSTEHATGSKNLGNVSPNVTE
jgi:hypothetical protein